MRTGGPQAKTRQLLDQVDEIFSVYEDYLPLTVRQLYYALVGRYDYPKTDSAYERLCEHLVRARRARLIPFEWLRDDGVVVIQHRWFDGTADFWDHIGQQAQVYRRDKQSEQRLYVELWTEAAGMMPQLARVAEDYSVPVYSCGGFASLSAVRQIVDRAYARNVPTVLLHVGDFDPSGEAVFDHVAGGRRRVPQGRPDHRDAEDHRGACRTNRRPGRRVRPADLAGEVHGHAVGEVGRRDVPGRGAAARRPRRHRPRGDRGVPRSRCP